MLKRALQWLVKSSEDSHKWALTVKALLLGIVPAILYFANLTSVQLSSETLTAVIDLIAQLITYVGGAIAALGFAWGVLRKIILTIKGENDVVLGWSEFD